MAGLVSYGEEDNNEEYDPHEHRTIEKPTSYLDTMTHLLKGSIGAGILAMPNAMSRVGVLVGFVGIVTVGIVAAYCIHLLILAQYQLCKRKRRGYIAYSKSMRIALEDGPKCARGCGRAAAFFVDTVLIIWQVGLCCVYVIFVASNIKQLLDFHEIYYSLRMHVVFILVPLALANMVMDLKFLSGMSSVANGLTILGLILVFYYLLETNLEIDDDKLFKPTLEGLPIFIGTTLFAIEAVGVILALEYNMEKPKQFIGLFGLFNLGMGMIISLYAIVGIVGYLKYGNNILASITLNLPETQKKAQVAKAFMAIAIFLSFPLQNFVAYSILMRKLKKKIKPDKIRITNILLKICLVLTPWGFAWLIPTLGPFIAFFGAFCLSLLGLVFPAILDLCTYYVIGYGPCNYKLFRDIILAIIGMSCLISGCHHATLEILEELQSEPD